MVQKTVVRNGSGKRLLALALTILMLLGALIALFVINNSSSESSTDTEAHAKFQQEYPRVSAEHPFVYTDANDTINILQNGTGLVFLGFIECPWCQHLVGYVDKAAQEEGLKTVNYLNIRESRTANDENYQKLVTILEEYLDKDEDGNPRIYVPDLTAVKDGEIVARYEQEPTDPNTPVTPDTYWTKERGERAVKQIREMIRKTRD